MHLGDRRCCQGLGIEALKYFLDGFAVSLVDNADGHLGRKWGYRVLELG